MNSTKPKRTYRVDELVLILVLTANAHERIKQKPEEVNAALALCEIAVSLPAEWFTVQERTLVGVIVQGFDIDPGVFVDNIRSGSVSYYAKTAETCVKETGRTVPPLHKMIGECLLAHLKEFGA